LTLGERHDRSIRSTALTLLGYIKEIRSLAGAGDDFHSSVSGRPSAEDAKEIESILSAMEAAIKNYWNNSGLSPDEKDIKWQMLVLTQFMEDLVFDLRPERLSKTHGNIGTMDQAKKLEELCRLLEEDIGRLKRVYSR